MMERNIMCCMVGCDNGSNGNKKTDLFPFPRDFNLCMLWVQNSGRPEFFEDFAFGGAQPFLNRHICADHFNETDFKNPQDHSLGLSAGVIPKLNLVAGRVTVKEEIVDPDDLGTLTENILSEPELLQEIKVEKLENDNCDELGGNFSFSSADDSGNDTTLNKLPSSDNNDIYQESQADKKLSDEFFREYETAKKGNRKRHYESHEERVERLKREALQAKLRRANESDEQKRTRRMKNALRAAFRRQNETPEQRETRKRKDMLRAQMRRKAETETEARIRRYNDAVRAAFRRNNETEEQRMERKMKDIVRAQKRRSLESPEQREERLRKDRERAFKKRMLKKIAEQLTRLDGLSELGVSSLPVMPELSDNAGLSGLGAINMPFKQEPLDSETQITLSSIGTIAKRCDESTNIEQLQQVLDFFETRTPRARGKRKKYAELTPCQNPPYGIVKSEVINWEDYYNVNKNSENSGLPSSVNPEVQTTNCGGNFDDIPVPLEPTLTNLVNVSNISQGYVEPKEESEELVNMLEPEVVWS